MSESDYGPSPADDSSFTNIWDEACDAVRSGDVEGLSDLLSKDSFLIRQKDPEVEHTLLHLAASSGNTEMIKFLISKGASVSATDINSETPGFHAVVAEQFDALKVLVDHGLNLEAKNEHDQTLLHVAAYWGNLEVTKYLVERGCKLDNQGQLDGKYYTPRQIALMRDHPKIVAYLEQEEQHSGKLLKSPGSPNARDDPADLWGRLQVPNDSEPNTLLSPTISRELDNNLSKNHTPLLSPTAELSDEEDLESHIQALQLKFSKVYEKKKKEWSVEKGRLETMMGKFQVDAEKFKQENARLRDSLQKQQLREDMKMREHQTTIQALQAQIQSLNDRFETETRAKRQIITSNTQMKQQIGNMRKETDEAKLAAEKLKLENDLLRQQTAFYKMNADQNSKDLELLRMATEQNRRIGEIVKMESDGLKKELEAVKQENQVLKLEADHYKRELEDLRSKFDLVKQDADENRHQIDSLKNEKEMLMKEKELLHKDLNLIKMDKETVKIENRYGFTPDPLDAKLELMGKDQLKEILFKLTARFDTVVELLKSKFGVQLSPDVKSKSEEMANSKTLDDDIVAQTVAELNKYSRDDRTNSRDSNPPFPELSPTTSRKSTGSEKDKEKALKKEKKKDKDKDDKKKKEKEEKKKKEEDEKKKKEEDKKKKKEEEKHDSVKSKSKEKATEDLTKSKSKDKDKKKEKDRASVDKEPAFISGLQVPKYSDSNNVSTSNFSDINDEDELRELRERIMQDRLRMRNSLRERKLSMSKDPKGTM